MNLKKHLQIIFFLGLLFNLSCTSYKNVPYFQDLKRDSVINEQINNYSALYVQPGDLLAIHVTSLNHEADALINYNLQKPNTNAPATVDRSDEGAATGYLVDHDGNINIAYLGTVKVSGSTLDQITKLLQDKLTEYLSKPILTVRLQNFKISVLGDVKSPNTYNISNDKITLLEALSLAGDLNTTGIRTNILLVRELGGKRTYVTIDLTKKDIFNSPYFYLKNNDVVYVQPNKERISNDSTFYVKAGLAISVLSILAIIFARNL